MKDIDMQKIDVGDLYGVEIVAIGNDIGKEGGGIARIDGFVVVIPDAPLLVGDNISIRITKVLGSVAFAELALGEETGFAKVERKNPELHINIIADAGFKVGMWEKLHATVMNVGEGEAKDIKISFSGPIEIGGVKTIPKLESGAKKETNIGMKPTEHGNLPLDVSISYMDENDTPFEINDVAYINVAKESETVPVQPQSIFNIGSIGEILGEGATKVDEGALVQRSEIGKGERKEEEMAFIKCPYCGEELNLPKTPKFCPYCGEQLK